MRKDCGGRKRARSREYPIEDLGGTARKPCAKTFEPHGTVRNYYCMKRI